MREQQGENRKQRHSTAACNTDTFTQTHTLILQAYFILFSFSQAHRHTDTQICECRCHALYVGQVVMGRHNMHTIRKGRVGLFFSGRHDGLRSRGERVGKFQELGEYSEWNSTMRVGQACV